MDCFFLNFLTNPWLNFLLGTPLNTIKFYGVVVNIWQAVKIVTLIFTVFMLVSPLIRFWKLSNWQTVVHHLLVWSKICCKTKRYIFSQVLVNPHLRGWAAQAWEPSVIRFALSSRRTVTIGIIFEGYVALKGWRYNDTKILRFLIIKNCIYDTNSGVVKWVRLYQ